jgi:adenylate cyclase
MFKMDYQRWADEADRALSLNPNFAPALNARGAVHIYTGQPEMAIPYIERAMRLDPAGYGEACLVRIRVARRRRLVRH